MDSVVSPAAADGDDGDVVVVTPATVVVAAAVGVVNVAGGLADWVRFKR